MKQRGNKLFSGSRMMLPEHRDLLLKRMAEETHIPKPLLDEQQYAEMEEALQSIMHSRERFIHLRVWRPEGVSGERGWLHRVDLLKQTVELRTPSGRLRSIPLDDIVHIEPDGVSTDEGY